MALFVAAVFAPALIHSQDCSASALPIFSPLGVKAGDWVKYGQLSVNWIGNGTAPSFVTDEMKTDWFRIDVLSVAGTTATLNDTAHYTNGTQTLHSVDVDVQNDSLPGYLFLVASNLTAGDPISQQGYASAFTINQTVPRTYAGAERTVNIIDSTFSLGKIKICWDQNTGIVVELYANETLGLAYPGGYMEETWKATETNLWSANAFDLIQNNLIYIITGIAVMIVIGAAVIVLRRRKPPPPQQTPTPSTPSPSP